MTLCLIWHTIEGGFLFVSISVHFGLTTDILVFLMNTWELDLQPEAEMTLALKGHQCRGQLSTRVIGLGE